MLINVAAEYENENCSCSKKGNTFQLEFEGLTGKIKFDEEGYRTDYKLDVYTVGLDNGPRKVYVFFFTSADTILCYLHNLTLKVDKKTKIRNRYNRIPHPTLNTKRERDTYN